MTDDITGLDLPRRKLLGALGAVGASSAGAGLGTSAFFNDTENFAGNSLTAGKLNLKLRGLTVATNSDAITVEDGVGNSTTIDGPSVETAFFTLGDIKPGDLAILCLEIIIEGNPTYLKISGSVVSNDGGLTEPEEASGDTSGQEGEGDLAQNTNIQAFGPTAQSVSGSSASSLQTTLQNNYQFSASTSGSSSGAGDFAGGIEVLMNQAFATATGGTDYVLTDGNGPECFEPDTHRLYFALSVDKDVGNIIQSDSLDLDLTVEAVQCRHNDTPFSDDP